MQVLLAKPRGFCAGVERALQIQGAPIYVHHDVVHNKFVTDDLRAKGAVFVEDLSEVPAGSTLIFSAHGVSQRVRRGATARGFKVWGATIILSGVLPHEGMLPRLSFRCLSDSPLWRGRGRARAGSV